MSAALSTLSATEGVLGTVVFDQSGLCVANDLKPPYEPVLMAEIVKRLNVVSDAVSSVDGNGVASLFASCEGGGIVYRRTDSHILLVLTKPDANLNMLNVAINVVTLNFARAGSTPSESLASGSVMSTNMTGPLVTQSDAIANDQIPVDAVGKAAVLQLLNIFVEYMGPAAKVVLKQQLHGLGVTARTLRRGQWEDLVTRLAAKLPSQQRQQEFVSAAHRIAA